MSVFYSKSHPQEAVTVELPSGTLSLTANPGELYEPSALLDYASRQNPKRAYLFVSKVLGKHLPARPAAMASTHTSLAVKLETFLRKANEVVVLGFAETATGLGAGVFEAIWRRNVRLQRSMLHLQTTRYRFNKPLALAFKEEHSHATGHLLYEPPHSSVFRTAESLILVDDELTTGKTNLNFLGQFLNINPCVKRVALVSLVNWMTPDHRNAFSQAYPSIEFDFVHLAAGSVSYTPREGFETPTMPAVESSAHDKSERVDCRASARFGWTSPLNCASYQFLSAKGLDPTLPVYVVGDGELMHSAYKIARELETEGLDVFVQASTRSPILVGNAIAEKVTYPDHYGDGIENYLYNPPPLGAQVVLVHEVNTEALALEQQLPYRKVIPIHIKNIISFRDYGVGTPRVPNPPPTWRQAV